MSNAISIDIVAITTYVKLDRSEMSLEQLSSWRVLRDYAVLNRVSMVQDILQLIVSEDPKPF